MTILMKIITKCKHSEYTTESRHLFQTTKEGVTGRDEHLFQTQGRAE